MNKKYINCAFSLLLAGFLPAMGMNWKWSKDNEFYEIHNYQIDEHCTFKLEDIKKIAEIDINKGILLEQHLKDLIKINILKPEISIQNILQNHIDKQQKLMGLIECAHFANHQSYKPLIQYLINNPHRIPKEIRESSDISISSFNGIKRIYTLKPQRTLKLIQEIVPEKNLTEWSHHIDSYHFDGIENDIKTCLYKQQSRYHETITNNTLAFLTRDNPTLWEQLLEFLGLTSEKEQRIKEITLPRLKNHFDTTSLPNKISLIIALQSAVQILLHKSDILKHQRYGLQSTLLLIATLGGVNIGLMISLLHVIYLNSRSAKVPLLKLLAPPVLLSALPCYFYLKSLPYAQGKKLERKTIPIQNLIEEFKESVKVEYN